MANLKIIFQERGEFTPSKGFISDAKKRSLWIKKVLKEEPKTKAYAFSSNKNSQLLKIIKKEVPELPIEFIEEERVSEVDLNKFIPNIIEGIISDKTQIMAFSMLPETVVLGKFANAYTKLKKLAQHVNDK